MICVAAASTAGLAGCTGSPGNPDQGASSTPARPDATSPTYQWSRVTGPAVAIGGGPSSTIAGILAPAVSGAAWLAVGTRTSASGTSTATVWTSPDGIAWTPSPLPAGPGDTQARAGARLGTATVVVGSSGTGGSQRAAVWVSSGPGRPFRAVPDGAAFSPTPSPSSGAGPATPAGGGPGSTGAVMDRVAAGALGVFAAGTVERRAAMWYSTDGSRWTRLAGAERVIDGSDQPSVNSLVVSPRGVWAAGSAVAGTATDAALWTSIDGIHWSAIRSAARSFTGNGDHVIDGLATLGTGFVAVGGVRTADQWMPASWISPDGFSWSQASEAFPMSPAASAGPPGAIAAAVAGTAVATAPGSTGADLVAVGGGPAAQRMWTSTDGLSWSEASLPPAAAAATGWRLSLVATRSATTIVADSTVGQPRLLADASGTWTEVTADPAAFGVPAPQAVPASLVLDHGQLHVAVDVTDPSQALGPAQASVVVLTSTDGSTWTAETSGGTFAGQVVRALLAVPDGLAAAGGQVDQPGQVAAAGIWTSPAGQAWTPAPAAPGTFGGGTLPAARATALARVGQVLVAVGHGGGTVPAPAAGPGAGAGAGSGAGPGTPGPSGSGVPDQAVAWVSAGGAPWQATGSLDPSPGLGAEEPLGACAGPQSVVAVGSGHDGTPGSRAMAWVSASGQTWQGGAITPAATPGEEERMTGCLTTGNGFLAYGTSAGPDGTADPALWQSAAGATWTRQDVAAFSGQGGGAIADLALRGTTWLAAGGGSADPVEAATAASALGLWQSGDAGATWQGLDTSSAPWVGHVDAQVDQVGFVGSSAVVAGQVDGQLALWTGTPAPPAARVTQG